MDVRTVAPAEQNAPARTSDERALSVGELQQIYSGRTWVWSEGGGYAGWRIAIGPDGRWLHLWYGPVDGEYD